MHTSVPVPLWVAAALTLVLLVAADLVAVAQRDARPSLRTCLWWVAANVSAAVLFGAALLATDGRAGTEFFAGYLTEYSLSVDNLFVFLVIMNTFAVPAYARDRTLLIGIVLSFVLRAVLIVGGTWLVSAASWTFYLFGLLLVYTAVGLLREQDQDDEFQEYAVLRWLRRYLPIAPAYDRDRLRTRVVARAMWTPAGGGRRGDRGRQRGLRPRLDPGDPRSHHGRVRDPHRQRLRAPRPAPAVLRGRGAADAAGLPPAGPCAGAGVIGVKLVLEGLRGSHFQHLGAVTVPEIGILPSLGFIVCVLGVAAVASLTFGARTPADRQEGAR